jgi:ketosteroid isomerase-like protein
MAIDRELTEDEQLLVALMTRNSWAQTDDSYHAADIDQLVGMYAPDAISIPANRPAMFGHDDLRAFYAGRTGDYEMNVVSEVDAVDVIGDLAVLVGIFRVTRKPEDGVAGLDHGGRWLAVMRRVDGRWVMWRDADTPSPDADVLYGRLARGL